VVDLREAFEYGQGYVALSRVRTLSGLYLLGVNKRALEVHPEALEQDAQFREQSASATETFARMKGSEVTEMHNYFLKGAGGILT
jgi:hypothetical protein